MTFADRLEELLHDKDSGGEEYAEGLICFLANNADAILELVRAAEAAQNVLGDRWYGNNEEYDYRDEEVIKADETLSNALAKLNGEQT